MTDSKGHPGPSAPFVAIRRATDEDADALSDLFLGSFHATYDFPLAHPDEEVRGWIRHTLIPQRETWVAMDRERIVGLLSLSPGWLDQLYVAPDRLGHGIGSQLVALAKRRQPDALQLWTFQVNARARRFYERHGFVAVEETDGSGNQERQPDVRYEWRSAAER